MFAPRHCDADTISVSSPAATDKRIVTKTSPPLIMVEVERV